MTDFDCDPGDGTCAYGQGYRGCYGGLCVIGRPLLVEGTVRVAPTRPSSDWLDPAQPRPEPPADAAVRRALADRFLAAAQLEHASVAAFARFALELLAFGAPADLVEDAAAAMADETAHARLCFTLAGHFGGAPVGPAPLPMEGVRPAATLALAVESAIVEGCLGETLAACDAAEEAAGPVEPILRDVWRRIAADERRHAELAWRFVRWALATGAPGVRERAAAAFDRALATPHPTAVARAACDTLVAPAARALLAA